MVSLMYETVPIFGSTWLECLGDIARYRMALAGTEKLTDRDIWLNISRYWYNKVADKKPYSGRLLHHLAMLKRSDALQQLFLLSCSLTCSRPQKDARGSLKILFDTVISGTHPGTQKLSPSDINFIKLMGLRFQQTVDGDANALLAKFVADLDGEIAKKRSQWKLVGVYLFLIMIAALLDFDSGQSPLRQVGTRHSGSPLRSRHSKELARYAAKNSARKSKNFSCEAKDQMDSDGNVTTPISFQKTCQLLSTFLTVILQRVDDRNIQPLLHSLLVFLYQIPKAYEPSAVSMIYASICWSKISACLNRLAKDHKAIISRTTDLFPQRYRDHEEPLPEDYLMRGLSWCETYFPAGWFDSPKLDEEERAFELPSAGKARIGRLFGVAKSITTVSSACKEGFALLTLSQKSAGLLYDAETFTWSAKMTTSLA